MIDDNFEYPPLIIEVLWQFFVYAIGFCCLLIAAILVLHGLDLFIGRRGERKHAYTCTVTGCGRPAEPSDGPFCPYHIWTDVP